MARRRPTGSMPALLPAAVPADGAAAVRVLPRPVLRAVAAGCAVLAAMTLAAGAAAPAHADLAEDRKEKVAQKAAIDQEIGDLRVELSGTNADLADTYVALRQTELEIPLAQAALEEAEAAAVEARRHDEETAVRLSDAESEEARLTGEVESGAEEIRLSDDQAGALALAAYKGGGMPDSASAVLGAESPQEALDRSYLYGIAMTSQNRVIGGQLTTQAVSVNQTARLTAVRAEVAELKKQAEEALAAKLAAEEQATGAKAALDALYAQQQTQAADLETKKAQYESEEVSLAQESDDLDAEITAIMAEEKRRAEEAARQKAAEEAARKKAAEEAAEAARRKAAAEQKSRAEQEEAARRAAADAGGSSSGGSSGSSSGSSDYIYPSDARISSEYGYRIHPVYGYRKLHAGTDFAGACGTPVKATASGRVYYVGYNSTAGNKVMINHGIDGGRMISSSYHHLEGFAVRNGEHVEQGETVGYVGTTGSSTGCHLHFAMYEDQRRVDPMTYI